MGSGSSGVGGTLFLHVTDTCGAAESLRLCERSNVRARVQIEDVIVGCMSVRVRACTEMGGAVDARGKASQGQTLTDQRVDEMKNGPK